jgi:signal transduction histidine kinase
LDHIIDATPLLDQGVLLGSIITIRDVTERLLDEEMGDDLLGRASHDLRTPLTALKASAQLIGRGFERLDDNAKQRTLALLLGQIDKLSTRIDEVMDASRIRRGRIDVQPEPLDLTALLREVCTELGAMPGMPRCELRAPAALRAQGDRTRIRQILKRLAVDAASRGTEGIVIDATSTGNVASITIEILGESADDSRRRTARRLATKIFERLGGSAGEDAAHRLVLTLPVASP